MSAPYFVTSPPAPKGRTQKASRRGGGGFRGALVYALHVPQFGGGWAGGGTREDRPVVSVWALASSARRPFVANVASGVPAVEDSGRSSARRLGYLRSQPWIHLYQETSAGPALHQIIAQGFTEIDPVPTSDDAEDDEDDEKAQRWVKVVTLLDRRTAAEGYTKAQAAEAAAWAQGLGLDRGWEALREALRDDAAAAPGGPEDAGEDCAPQWALSCATWWLAQVDRRLVVPVLREPSFALQAWLAALGACPRGGAQADVRHAAVFFAGRRTYRTSSVSGASWEGLRVFAPAQVTVATSAALTRVLTREIRVWAGVRAARAEGASAEDVAALADSLRREDEPQGDATA